jgi:hypothetical protein
LHVLRHPPCTKSVVDSISDANHFDGLECTSHSPKQNIDIYHCS